MSETAEALSPLEAARVLAQARGYESDLRVRTSGITWMVWGLVTPAIFLSYAFASVVAPGAWWAGWLWAPWIGAGTLVTSALWRSAAIQFPALRTFTAAQFGLRFALVLLAYVVVFWLIPVRGPGEALIAVGLTWLSMGALGVMRVREKRRWVAIAAGSITAGVGLVLFLLRVPQDVAGTVSIVVSGAVPLAAGLWQTLRG
jgi:hypothetical protein